MLAHVQDDVVRPRRIWEQQQQMKTAVPITACSTKYGRPAAPRAAPTCPGETWAAGRAVSAYSQGEVAASEAVATCPSVRVFVDCVPCACPGAAAAAARATPSPGHLPAAQGGAVAIRPDVVQLQETVIQKSVPEEIVAKKGTSGKGHAAQISKGRKG